MDGLKGVAGSIPIVEDAAHACGSEYKGRRCGSIGDLGCFSFHAVKNLATGDGGALALSDEMMADRAHRLRWLAIDTNTWRRGATDEAYSWDYRVDEIGYKSQMNDIAAALGIVQLKKLPANNARRRAIAEQYTNGLGDLPWLQTPPMDSPASISSWHIYSVQCDNREGLRAHLERRQVRTGVHYRPIHLHKCYDDTPVLAKAEHAFHRILSLPMHPGLSTQDVDYVIESIREFPA